MTTQSTGGILYITRTRAQQKVQEVLSALSDEELAFFMTDVLSAKNCRAVIVPDHATNDDDLI